MKYEAIEKGIANGDLPALRSAIGNICYTSRNFSSGEFDEAIRYVESKGIKIKEEFLADSPLISETKNVYTDEDFERAVFELKENFCDQRIEDVKKIGKTLYVKNHVEQGVGKNKERGEIQVSPKEQSHQNEKKVWLKVAVLVAVVLIILLVCQLLK